MVDESEVAELTAERPELADAIEDVLTVDEEHDGWAFEDVPVDTGVFGELVGEGIVTETDDGYRVADPAAVRAGLEQARSPDEAGDSADSTAANGGSPTVSNRDIDLPSVGLPTTSVRRIAPLFGALALFVVLRTTVYGSIFRGGDVVLMGNDPYFYRYHVESLLSQSTNPLALSTVADAPTGEPLLVATLWWVSALLGGTREVAGLVLAWYPVVAGLAVAVLLYALGARVFADRRVGLVGVVVLAVIPGHAMRTALGFADHHAFDYAWLMAVVVALAWIAALRERTGNEGGVRWPPDRPTWVASTALGVAIAGLTLSWEGSPVLLAPLGLYAFVRVPLDVRDGRRPAQANAPLLAGLGVGTLLSVAAHVALGWQDATVVAAPGVLLAGIAVLVGLGELGRRYDIGTRAYVAVQSVAAVAGIGALSILAPAAVERLRSRLDFLFDPSAIGETISLFDPSRTFGVDLVGLVVVFALPFMVGGVWHALRDDRWLVVTVFGWWYLFLSALQLRFVGQLAPLVALFAGFGVVSVLDRLELAPGTPTLGTDDATGDETEPTDPDRQWLDREHLTVRSALTVVALLGLLVGPAASGVADEVHSPVVDDRVYETATWIAEDADRRDASGSERYVFSRWGVNRVYNYFASGDSESYGYAQSNYIDFLDSNDPEQWYERLQNRSGTGAETGYIVLTAIERRPNTLFHHLWVTYGSRWPDRGYDAVSHYRMVYVTENFRNKVFVLVPGASVNGTAEPGTTVEAETRVEIPNLQFDYRTQTTAGPDGSYSLVVPYPGEYELSVGNETETVTVPGSAVRNGWEVIRRE